MSSLATSAGVSVEEKLSLLRRMVTIRRFDELAKKAIERGEMGGEIHPYIGEEAVAVGVCSMLRQDDGITSTHRGHGHMIAKGADVRRMMAELGGKRDGYSRGKGGSKHMAVPDIGFYCDQGIVSGGISHAVGLGFAAQYNGTDAVAVSFFGDGAVNEGVLHESMNLAAIYQLPVLFVCENNHYAATTPIDRVTKYGGEHIAERARAYGMPGVFVDGMDVLAVRAVAADAVTRARTGGGPTFIEADTYRYLGHWTAESRALKVPYRSQDEIDSYMARDPIARLQGELAADGVGQERLAAVEAEVVQEIEGAVEFMKASPPAEAEAAYEDVYATYEPTMHVEGW